MKLTYLLITALILSLVMAKAAFGQPPEEIPNSLIPPLREKPVRTAGRAAAVVRVADATAAGPTTPANGATNGPTVPAAPVTPVPNSAAGPYANDPAAANDYDARMAIWNSPEMIDARRYVLEYSQRSARSSLKEGEQFLARVSQLSPTEMKAWLERLQARRDAIARQQEVTSAARQFSLEQAAQRQQQSRQSHANINQWQSLSAQFLQERLQSQQALTQQRQSYRDFGRSAAIAGQRVLFDPFAPTLDPVSPSRRVRAFAAATLPGDLPPSDSQNFERNPSAASDATDRSQTAPAPAAAAEAASAPPSGE